MPTIASHQPPPTLPSFPPYFYSSPHTIPLPPLPLITKHNYIVPCRTVEEEGQGRAGQGGGGGRKRSSWTQYGTVVE